MSTAEPAAAGTEQAAPPQAVRRKSGLVRTAGTWDTFVFALCGISVGIMVQWGDFWGKGFYPGASVILAAVIAIAAASIVAWAYHFWGEIFPRSGGDYVFVSRGTFPGFGFAVNVVYIFMIFATPALAITLVQPLVASFSAALSEILGAGFLADWATFFNTNDGFAVIGFTALALSTLFAALGLRRLIGLMKVIVITGVLGGLITIIGLVFADPDAFAGKLQEYSGLSEAQVLGVAADNGFAEASFSFEKTMQLSSWFATSLFFVSLLLYIGGEIKNAQRNVRFALTGAVWASGAMAILWLLAYSRAVPADLRGALSYNSFVAPDGATPQIAYPHELIRVVFGTDGFGAVLTVVSFLALLAWGIIWIPQVIALSQRAILAWSLDGLVPASLGRVSERFHSPLNALVVTFLGCGAWMLAYAYDTDFRTIALTIPIYVAFAVSMAVGTVFPYARRELFEQSVVARARILGVPLMSVFCGLGTAIFVGWAVMVWNDPTASGTSRAPVWIAAIAAVAVLVYYVAFSAYKRSRGEDIGLRFKQIPVE
ncbi:MAG: hypothetical protein MUC84_06605 [Solirubrobacteraceae bacterium]|nr:hypothetical protein [Solirubrobacteraceae bacterium]